MSSPAQASETRKPLPEFGFSYAYFAIDVGARYLLLVLWRYLGVPAWLFWVGQVGVGVAMLAYADSRDTAFMRKYGAQKPGDVQPKPAPGWIITWLVLSLHAGYQTFGTLPIAPGWGRVAAGSLLSVVATSYLLVLALYSESDKNLPRQIGDPYEDVVDENDRVLIRLHTEIHSLERRIESYTIESTLIGALAFSAFVTIVSSDKGTASGIRAVVSDVSKATARLVSLDLVSAMRMFQDLSSEKTVLASVAALALTCSTFFLAVIVARLRFNSLIGLVNYSIEVADAFNRKEEALHEHVQFRSAVPAALTTRLDMLHQRISESLEEARQTSAQVRPIVLYMTIFRDLGVLTFLATLVVSALWVSWILAGIFLGISVLAFSYPWLDRKIRDHRLWRHGFFYRPSFLRRQK